MSKAFFRYEDVPLLMASEGQSPVLVFADNATLSASQPIDATKFVDDHQISFALQSGDIKFTGAYEAGFLMGPPNGPGIKIVNGFGIDRMAVMRHGITDIRDMYVNDIRFIEQF